MFLYTSRYFDVLATIFQNFGIIRLKNTDKLDILVEVYDL